MSRALLGTKVKKKGGRDYSRIRKLKSMTTKCNYVFLSLLAIKDITGITGGTEEGLRTELW